MCKFKTHSVVVEKLKQTIIAVGAMVSSVDRLRQNRMFQNNQRQFYRELNQKNKRQFYGELNQEGKRCDDDQPDAEESKKFLGNIWSETKDMMMISQMLKNQKSFCETYGVSR